MRLPARRTLAIPVVGVLLAALAACQGEPEDQGEQAPPTQVVTGPPPSRGPGGLSTTGFGPPPPARGAWLGAWVKPEWNTPSGRAAALQAFITQTKAPLAIAHMYHDWADDFPDATDDAFRAMGKLLMLSWAGTDTRSITSGVYDDKIRARAQAVKDYGVPILLRFRWEMDRPNLQASVHSPEDYVAAWKHVRAIFTREGATNAGWVWCPHVEGFTDPSRNGAAYYPGDDQVDWLCTDVYPGREKNAFTPQMDAFMAFAAKHPRPVMVGEFGVTTQTDGAERAAWLREAHDYARNHPQIKAMVYFAAKQTKPTYDSTFNDDPEGLAAFQRMAEDPHFDQPPPAEHTATPVQTTPADKKRRGNN